MPMLTAAERLAAMASTLDSSAMLPSTQVTGGGPGGGHTHVWGEVPSGAVDGVNPTFILGSIPTALMVFKNGLLQRAGAGNDYTLAGAVITFLQDNLPQPGDVVLASYTT